MAEERVEPDRTPIGDQAQPAKTATQDCARMPDARDPPGHPRHRRERDRGRNGAQAPVLMDDEIEVEPMKALAGGSAAIGTASWPISTAGTPT